jgi:acyl-CoA synthetase (NDP forming)
LGGIFVEVYKDVVARVAPFDESEAREMFDELKGKKILHGARGFRVDLDTLASIVSRFSEFLYAHPEFKEVDVNPLFATRNGIFAVDARIVL